MRPASDRRRAERVRPGPLRVRLHRTCEGILVDLSELGALVHLLTEQKPENKVTLHLEWKDETLQLPARIVRSIPYRVQLPTAVLARTGYHVGLEFRDLSQEAAAALKGVIHRNDPPVAPSQKRANGLES